MSYWQGWSLPQMARSREPLLGNKIEQRLFSRNMVGCFLLWAITKAPPVAKVTWQKLFLATTTPIIEHVDSTRSIREHQQMCTVDHQVRTTSLALGTTPHCTHDREAIYTMNWLTLISLLSLEMLLSASSRRFTVPEHLRRSEETWAACTLQLKVQYSLKVQCPPSWDTNWTGTCFDDSWPAVCSFSPLGSPSSEAPACRKIRTEDSKDFPQRHKCHVTLFSSSLLARCSLTSSSSLCSRSRWSKCRLWARLVRLLISQKNFFRWGKKSSYF